MKRMQKKNYNYVRSNKSTGVDIQLSFTYVHELDNSQKYRTIVMNRIHNDIALILKSEMINLNELLE